MSDKAIIRAEKLKTVQQIASASGHNTRLFDVENADPEGQVICIAGSENALAEYERVMDAHDAKAKKDSVLAIEYVLTFSPEMNGKIDLDEWAKANLEYIEKRHGKDKVIQAMLHLDEKTPHMHIIAVPLDLTKKHRPNVKDPKKIAAFKPHWKLNCKKWTGGSRKMSAMQSSYAKAMEGFGLTRGVEGSKAVHAEIKHERGLINQDYEAAVKQWDEIENKTNMFNKSKMKSFLKDLFVQLTVDCASLARKVTMLRAKEKGTDKLLGKMRRFCKIIGAKTFEDMPAAINPYIDKQVKRRTAELETKLDDLTEKHSELARDHRMAKKTPDNDLVKELEHKNNLLRAKNDRLNQEMDKLKP